MNYSSFKPDEEIRMKRGASDWIENDLSRVHASIIYACAPCAIVTKQFALDQSRDSLLKLVPFPRRDSPPTRRRTLADARVLVLLLHPMSRIYVHVLIRGQVI